MKELNEMTIGRTDDPENPISVPAFEAAKLFGAGSRNPSGPADMVPRQQAGHMLAIDPPVRILNEALASEGPSTHTLRRQGICADCTVCLSGPGLQKCMTRRIGTCELLFEGLRIAKVDPTAVPGVWSTHIFDDE
jgi:hypothetical protein